MSISKVTFRLPLSIYIHLCLPQKRNVEKSEVVESNRFESGAEFIHITRRPVEAFEIRGRKKKHIEVRHQHTIGEYFGAVDSLPTPTGSVETSGAVQIRLR